jgi:hypothetical protein
MRQTRAYGISTTKVKRLSAVGSQLSALGLWQLIAESRQPRAICAANPFPPVIFLAKRSLTKVICVGATNRFLMRFVRLKWDFGVWSPGTARKRESGTRIS